MDFCNESLGTKVRASHIHFDGHEVNNLISNSSHQHKKGFIAESFVKPPVDIIFTFPCNVEISSVQLCTSVGCQKSIGIDLLSLISKSGTNSKKPEDDLPSNYEEVLLAKCYLSTESEVHFVNPLFKGRPPFTIENYRKNKSTSTLIRNMKCTMNKPLCASQGVKLRIWKTANRSQPAMSSVSIYGIPSRSVSEQIVHQLLAAVKPTYSASQQIAMKETDLKEGQITVTTASKNSLSGIEDIAPEEFIDPITNEIMTFPVVLPSGNTIDQITLSRHTSSEFNWGRQASDPFTGVAFSAGRQPVPNAFLKSRIDKFLLQHEHLANGRTTGTFKRRLEPRTLSKNSETDFETNSQKKFCSVTVTSLSHQPVTSHKPDCEEQISNHNWSSTSLETDSELPTLRDCSKQLLSTSVPTVINHSETVTDHETRLNQSLDLALQAVLSTKTPFSSVDSSGSKWNNLFQTPVECVACKIHSKGLPFYQLPCSHKMCRKCVTSLTITCAQNKCPICGMQFFPNQLSRCHP